MSRTSPRHPAPCLWQSIMLGSPCTSGKLSCQLRWALSGGFTSSYHASSHQLARLQRPSVVSELINISAERLWKVGLTLPEAAVGVPEHPSEQPEVPFLSLCSSAGVASYRGGSGYIYPQLESLPIEENLARFTQDPCWWWLFWAKVNDYHDTLYARDALRARTPREREQKVAIVGLEKWQPVGNCGFSPPALHNCSMVVVYL